MRARASLVVVLGLGLGGFLFWSAHRAPAQHEQRVQTASPADSAVSAPLATMTAELPAPSAVSTAPSAPPPQNEMALMDDLRRFKDTDPQFAVDRAREGNARFPNSADAPERTSILIHALSTLGQTSEARGLAEDMVNRYPDSSFVREIEHFTGAHRHRNVHLDSAGKLAYDEQSATAP